MKISSILFRRDHVQYLDDNFSIGQALVKLEAENGLVEVKIKEPTGRSGPTERFCVKYISPATEIKKP